MMPGDLVRATNELRLHCTRSSGMPGPHVDVGNLGIVIEPDPDDLKAARYDLCLFGTKLGYAWRGSLRRVNE